MVTWGSVGHGDVRVRGSARRERVGESRRRVGNALFSVTPLTRSVSGECVGYGGCPCLCASKMRYYGSEAAVRRADPFSVNPGPRPGLEWRGRYAPQGGAAVDVGQECISGGASATHLHRCVYPRRCRGLTEGVTARAVRLRLWRSSASPMRRRLRAETAEGSDVDGRNVTNL